MKSQQKSMKSMKNDRPENPTMTIGSQIDQKLKKNKRFKKKMIGFGRPDEIEKKDPGRRPPHAASKNVPNPTYFNENR